MLPNTARRSAEAKTAQLRRCTARQSPRRSKENRFNCAPQTASNCHVRRAIAAARYSSGVPVANHSQSQRRARLHQTPPVHTRHALQLQQYAIHTEPGVFYKSTTKINPARNAYITFAILLTEYLQVNSLSSSHISVIHALTLPI